MAFAFISGMFIKGHGTAFSWFLLPPSYAINLLSFNNGPVVIVIGVGVIFVQFLLIYWLIFLLVDRGRQKPGLAIITISLVLVLMAGSYAYNRHQYPYGASHCCINAMSLALYNYAEDHGGRYPVGESSPEASLSLLCNPEYMPVEEIFRGMTIPLATVHNALKNGGRLGPDSCGWHYVEGLTKADDPRLALLYCKVALGHNGQRTSDGGRQVVLISGGIDWVSGAKWPKFLEQQKQLLLKRTEREKLGLPVVDAVIELPDGSQIEKGDGPYKIVCESKGPDNYRSRGQSSDGPLSRTELVWMRPPIQNGSVTRTISFSILVSEPVTVAFVDGAPDQNKAVFKMKKRE